VYAYAACGQVWASGAHVVVCDESRSIEESYKEAHKIEEQEIVLGVKR
jgi:hypothetical protein